MTTTGAPTPTPGAAPWFKRMHWKGWVQVSVVGFIAFAFLGVKALDAIKAKPTDPQQDYNVAKLATADALAAALPPTTEPAPVKPPPDYDYLTCSHVTPQDAAPCTPLYPWPLTEGAINMIGFQNGGRAERLLNTANTRELVTQMRPMVNVDPCDMWLGLKFDQAGYPVLTVYRSKVEAPAGSAELYDCTVRAGVTTGTLYTEGGA